MNVHSWWKGFPEIPVSWYSLHATVTESKFVLLTAQQANKPRDELLGQGMETLSWKSVDWEDSGLASQRTMLPRLAFRFLLYEKVCLVVANFLIQAPFVLVAVQVDVITVFL